MTTIMDRRSAEPRSFEEAAGAVETARFAGEMFPADVSKTYRRVLFCADDLLRQFRDEAVSRRGPLPANACRRGCSFCCFLQVECHPVEIFGLVEGLRATNRRWQLRELVEKLRRNVAKTAGLPVAEHAKAKAPCALLAPDGTCTIYPVRPLRCRGWTSRNRDHCAAELEPGEQAAIKHEAWPMMAAEIAGASLRRLAGDDSTCELQHGLLIALTEPDAYRRWLAGEDVLAPARRDSRAEARS